MNDELDRELLDNQSEASGIGYMVQPPSQSKRKIKSNNMLSVIGLTKSQLV